jgi:hypothetical protein
VSPVAGYCRKLNSKLTASALLVPLLNTDMKVVRSTDYHFGGVLKAVYNVYPDLSVRATLGYRQQYYGTQYILFLGCDWKLNSRWRLFGDLPNNATLAYALQPKINAGLIYLAGNTTYRLSAPDDYLLYDYAQTGLFIEYYLTDFMAARGTFTTSTIRKLDLFPASEQVPGGVLDYIPLGKAPQALNAEVSNGPAIRLSLCIRYPDKK